MPEFTIRTERPEDAAEVRRAVIAAFESETEGNLVDSIRISEHFIPDLSIVAQASGAIVGHVMVSRVHLVDGDRRIEAHSLAPLSVISESQGAGIGSALVQEAITRADAMGLPLLLVEGSPRYYGRLGFVHSVPLGIHFDLPEWAPPEAAQVRRLSAYDPSIVGRVEYPPAFDIV